MCRRRRGRWVLRSKRRGQGCRVQDVRLHGRRGEDLVGEVEGNERRFGREDGIGKQRGRGLWVALFPGLGSQFRFRRFARELLCSEKQRPTPRLEGRLPLT